MAEDAVRVSARARGRMRVGSEWHLLSSRRLEQAVYEHHPSTTQMLTQMLLATVSLCVLCETAVRSRPCAQLLPQRAEHALLDDVGVARSRPTQREKRRGLALKVHNGLPLASF